MGQNFNKWHLIINKQINILPSLVQQIGDNGLEDLGAHLTPLAQLVHIQAEFDFRQGCLNEEYDFKV